MFFPLRNWTKIEPQAVQSVFREAFIQWGLPLSMRFDNGVPWGHPGSAVPTALALWLVGLGIRPLFGRPRQSTDNAVVERCHGVLKGWVEPQTCTNLFELRQRLRYFATMQREHYPFKENTSRLAAFPNLRLNSRPYQTQQEKDIWKLETVLDYVARYTFTRTVEKNGRITLMTHEYSLGRKYRAQRINARLDPQQKCWFIKDRFGEPIATFPALQFDYLILEPLLLTSKHFKAKLGDVSSEV